MPIKWILFLTIVTAIVCVIGWDQRGASPLTWQVWTVLGAVAAFLARIIYDEIMGEDR